MIYYKLENTGLECGIMIQSETYIAIPPGETIKEQLDDRGMLQKEFALRMGMSEKHISRLINGDVQLTIPVAIKLESVLGLPTKFWTALETRYREKIEKANAENGYIGLDRKCTNKNR